MSKGQAVSLPVSSEHPPELAPQQQAKKGKRADLLSPLRLNRLSTLTYDSAADKGKTPMKGGEYHDGSPPSSQAAHGFNNPASHYVNSRPGSASGSRLPPTNLSRKRGSLLVAATDALGFKFNRKRQTIPARLPTTTTFLPEIIEITAHRTSDAEWEERERLREEAAQCLGISVEQDTASINHTTEENNIANFSTNSLPSPTRRRSGSSITHYRRASNTAIPIPSFPANMHVLKDFTQLSATLPMFNTPHSLRIFTLSKNWKVRFVALTSPVFPMTYSSEPAVSYLHIFKSSAADEKEIERLEINENSVVFIAEDDVGGRRRVVKVGGGGDKNGTKKNQVIEDGRVTWFFHIPDLAESQKWIAAIKNVILAQRTVRAGLGLPSPVSSGIEPRGDMDVMLSIRQQGIVTVPSTLRQSTSITDRSGNYASSISSQSIKSQTTGPKTPPSSNSPGALKSLFIPRPRAASSLDSDRENESFLSMSHLINKLRPNVAESRKSSEKSFVPPLSTFTSASSTLERKIVNGHLPDSLPDRFNDGTTSVKGDQTCRSSSFNASSLQPPPRRRRGSEALAISLAPPMPPYYDCFDETLMIDPSPSNEPTSNQRFSHFGSPKLRPRVQSAHSISTIASGDNTTSQDMSSISTKRSSKRWSRQSVLPARPSPPGGPPPPTPLNTHLQPHPYAAEQGISRTPSNRSEKSVTISLAPFSPDRTSTASAFSVKSGTSQSLGMSTSRSSHTSSSHRSSIPPSKPAPSFALPPAPGQQPNSSTPNKSFKESVASRVGRLSIIAPKPAPTTSLPPRPDEGLSKSRRRASSSSYLTTPGTSSDDMASPFPPPLMPLPPTPKIDISQSLPPSPSPLAHNENLIIRRLRMLSAPPTPPSVVDDIPVDIPNEPSHLNAVRTPIVQAPKPVLASLVMKPVTPVLEKITTFQDDPSFLHFDTPTVPPLPPPRVSHHIPDQSIGMTSLSPPPRRSSRQIFPADVPEPDNVILSTPTPRPPTDGERKVISLSQPESVVSLGIVSM